MRWMQFLLIFGMENFSRLTRHPLLSSHYFYFQDTLSGRLCSAVSQAHTEAAPNKGKQKGLAVL